MLPVRNECSSLIRFKIANYTQFKLSSSKIFKPIYVIDFHVIYLHLSETIMLIIIFLYFCFVLISKSVAILSIKSNCLERRNNYFIDDYFLSNLLHIQKECIREKNPNRFILKCKL